MPLTAELAACLLACAFLAAACPAATSATPTKAERADAHKWVNTHILGDAAAVPFSFTYGGQSSRELLATWKRAARAAKIDAARTTRTVTWTDPATGLEVRLDVLEFADVPAVEWVLHFKNTGSADTPIIEGIQALDTLLPSKAADGFTLHHSLGDSNSADSFRPLSDAIAPGPGLTYAPAAGRSSEGPMPFFNVAGPDGGIALAIGWTGQWAASFRREDGGVRMRAGLELTHLTLHPGEEIRTPRMLLAFWRGGEDLRGNQLLRQTLSAHYTPRRNGQIVFTPICGSVFETDPDGTYEGPHVRVMKPLADLGVEIFWSDMDPQQWYPGGFPNGTGTWEPDLTKYPRGLKPVGDAARAAGLGYLLWFEPERVAKGSQIAREHPEWVEGGANGGLYRLDLPEAWKWITEKVDVQVSLAQLAWVRWDFNIQPLAHWRHCDAPDRQGMTEIRYIEGLYAMWDELERRHPGLLLDICASGGRRLDIEMLSRGLPLWHSDLQCEGAHPEADQLQNAGLYRWLPLHASGLFGLEPSYECRSNATTGNIICLAAHDPKNAEGVRRTVALQKKLRPYALGDFYPTLPHRVETDHWFAYQLHRQDLDAGCLFVYRRAKCGPSTILTVAGVRPSARYEVEFEGTPGAKVMTGKELAALRVEVPEAPGAAIVIYRKAAAK